MRLHLQLCGDASKASSRVRGFWVAEELEAQGVVCLVRFDNSKWGLLCSIRSMLSSDVVVFQKVYSRYHIWLAVLASAFGKDTYLDIDDAPSRTNNPKTLKNFRRMCALVDGVFCGSPALMEYVSSPDVQAYLVPTGVRVDSYTAAVGSSDETRPCVGWIGNGLHYERDLIQFLRGPIASLLPDYSFRLKLVGTLGCDRLREEIEQLGHLEVELIDELDWSDELQVQTEISDFDIGVYPLSDAPFNRYKCGFKALEYMASGVPVVADRNTANERIIDHGQTGFLVESESEWLDCLQSLIEDRTLRHKLATEGRLKVEKEYSVESVARKMLGVMLGS